MSSTDQVQSVPVLYISGPVGVGKTSVGGELGEVLIERDVPHTFLDFDQLTYTHPRPAGDQWGERLALRHLQAFWRHCYEAGARNLVISQVCETQGAVDNMSRVIPGATPTVVQLTASLACLHERVRKREIGSGLQWHLNRSGELLTILTGANAPCDVRIDTDRCTIRELAEELASLISWER